MPTINPQIEFNRAENAVRPFGWRILQRDVSVDDITIQITKEKDPKQLLPDSLEVERPMNILAGLGWILRRHIDDTKSFIVEVSKKIPPADAGLPT
jgi:hypothetical protein